MGYVRGRSQIKERLRIVRRSQRWLADKMKRPEQQISDWANDRTSMGIEVARNASYWLKCHMEDLYVWKWVDDDDE